MGEQIKEAFTIVYEADPTAPEITGYVVREEAGFLEGLFKEKGTRYRLEITVRSDEGVEPRTHTVEPGVDPVQSLSNFLQTQFLPIIPDMQPYGTIKPETLEFLASEVHRRVARASDLTAISRNYEKHRASELKPKARENAQGLHQIKQHLPVELVHAAIDLESRIIGDLATRASEGLNYRPDLSKIKKIVRNLLVDNDNLTYGSVVSGQQRQIGTVGSERLKEAWSLKEQKYDQLYAQVLATLAQTLPTGAPLTLSVYNEAFRRTHQHDKIKQLLEHDLQLNLELKQRLQEERDRNPIDYAKAYSNLEPYLNAQGSFTQGKRTELYHLARISGCPNFELPQLTNSISTSAEFAAACNNVNRALAGYLEQNKTAVHMVLRDVSSRWSVGEKALVIEKGELNNGDVGEVVNEDPFQLKLIYSPHGPHQEKIVNYNLMNVRCLVDVDTYHGSQTSAGFALRAAREQAERQATRPSFTEQGKFINNFFMLLFERFRQVYQERPGEAFGLE